MKYGLDEITKISEELKTSTYNGPTFFSLKNNGDYAFVRFVYNSVEELDIATVHTLEAKTKDGKSYFPRVSCIRNPKDPIEYCPLCEAGEKFSVKFFAKMLCYGVYNSKNQLLDSKGNIQEAGVKPEIKAVIWEKGKSFADEVKEYILNYGNLTDYLFKIVRKGVAGDLHTTYTIIPCTSPQFSKENFPIDLSGFEGYEVDGNAYGNYSFEELTEYLRTGVLPSQKKEESEEGGTFEDTSVQQEVQQVPNFPQSPTPQNVGVQPNTWGQPTTPNAINQQGVGNGPRRYNFNK